MRHPRALAAGGFALLTVFIGPRIFAQYGGSGGSAPGTAGGTYVSAPLSCPLSNTPEAATSSCVTVVIPPGATGLGPNAYGSNPLGVARGATVIWYNQDSVSHTVTSDDGSFDSGSIAPGQYFAHTFGAAGNSTYYCRIHGRQSMSGSISVSSTPSTPVPCSCQAPGMASPTPSPSPSPSASPSPSPSPSASPSPAPSSILTPI